MSYGFPASDSDGPKVNAPKDTSRRELRDQIVLINSANCYQIRLGTVALIFSVQVLFPVLSGRDLVEAFEVANKMAHVNVSDSHSYLLHCEKTAFQELSSSF